MHPRIILAIARKDAIDILLNKSMLFNLLVPILISLLYLFIRLLDALIGSHATDILVYNPGQSNVAQVVISAFSGSQVAQANAASEVTAAFGPNGSHKSSLYAIGLIIPANFESDLRANNHPQVNLYINGDAVDTRTAALVQAAIDNYAPCPRQSAVVDYRCHCRNQSALQYEFRGCFREDVHLDLTVVLVHRGHNLCPSALARREEKKTIRILMVTTASFGDVVVGNMTGGADLSTSPVWSCTGDTERFYGTGFARIAVRAIGLVLQRGVGLALRQYLSNIDRCRDSWRHCHFHLHSSRHHRRPVEQLLDNSPIVQVMRIVPTYYIADGIYNAIQNQGTWGNTLLDIGVIVGCILVLLAVSIWMLRRQASVAAAI